MTIFRGGVEDIPDRVSALRTARFHARFLTFSRVSAASLIGVGCGGQSRPDGIHHMPALLSPVEKTVSTVIEAPTFLLVPLQIRCNFLLHCRLGSCFTWWDSTQTRLHGLFPVKLVNCFRTWAYLVTLVPAAYLVWINVLRNI